MHHHWFSTVHFLYFTTLEVIINVCEHATVHTHDVILMFGDVTETAPDVVLRRVAYFEKIDALSLSQNVGGMIYYGLDDFSKTFHGVSLSRQIDGRHRSKDGWPDADGEIVRRHLVLVAVKADTMEDADDMTQHEHVTSRQ